MALSGTRFGAEYRLHTPADYAVVFNHRRALKGEWFQLHYSPSVGSVSRLGLVIPKKHARHAVTRNLLKRISREAFRHARGGLPALNLVFRLVKPVGARSDHGSERRGAWRTEIDGLLGRLPR